MGSKESHRLYASLITYSKFKHTEGGVAIKDAGKNSKRNYFFHSLLVSMSATESRKCLS